MPTLKDFFPGVLDSDWSKMSMFYHIIAMRRKKGCVLFWFFDIVIKFITISKFNRDKESQIEELFLL